MNPRLSVVLPVFNRVALLAHPLKSLRAAVLAAPGLTWELVVVDDGSTEDVAAALAPYADLPVMLHRLPQNSGLLRARLEGLNRARGDAVFFLDADDAILPEKFTIQLDALAHAEVVHGDMARRVIDASGCATGPLRLDSPSHPVAEPAAFYLTLQPAPHDPIFRRTYLQAAIGSPLCLPSRTYDSIAETWFYYHLALRPARIVYCPGVYSIVGEPAGDRLSRRWERQCAAAVRLMEEFLRNCPGDDSSSACRRRIGCCAFSTWRALPTGFPPAHRLLAIWRQCPASPLTELGGPTFARVARLLGPVTAGRLFRLVQRPAYARVRTTSDKELRNLFA